MFPGFNLRIKMQIEESVLKQLLEKLDKQQEALASLTKALTSNSSQIGSLASPTVQVVHSPPQLASPSHLPHDLGLASYFDNANPPQASIFTGEESSDSDDDESMFVQETLPPESYSVENFRNHLKVHRWDRYAQQILGPVLQDRDLRTAEDMFREDDSTGEAGSIPRDTHATVYDIGPDGAALWHRPASKEPEHAIWLSLHTTNSDAAKRRLATGKITIIREPSPLLFGAIHLTMEKHFDMDSIFRLLSDESTTRAYMRGCFEPEPTKQRSFLFCFKYHTIIHDERKPFSWQSHDDPTIRTDKTHIPITSCSSVVALSLSGSPVATLKNRSRRKKAIEGNIYDPFAPWHVLSIQCYPDWRSNVDVHDANRHYVNGCEAFLVTVLAEYRDAQKRFFDIARRVSALTSPPQDFMFNRETRDNLLFEDDHYTFSRRYFWATQTLAVMNDNIQAMMKAYKDTFTDEVWTGTHKYIWPGRADQSSRHENWRRRMNNLRKAFEVEMEKLEELMDINTQEMKDIKALRDQLFSGTSVRESREALKVAEITVQQNRNIKLLTLVTIFFLPLTFVTSVYGMTNMPPEDTFLPFAATTAAICLPTYFLIGILNSRTGQNSILKALAKMFPAKMQNSGNKSRPRRQRSGIGSLRNPSPPPGHRRSRSFTSSDGFSRRWARPNSRSGRRQSHELERLSSLPSPASRPQRHQSTIKFDFDSMKSPGGSISRGASSPEMREFAPDEPSSNGAEEIVPLSWASGLIRFVKRKFSMREIREEPV